MRVTKSRMTCYTPPVQLTVDLTSPLFYVSVVFHCMVLLWALALCVYLCVGLLYIEFIVQLYFTVYLYVAAGWRTKWLMNSLPCYPPLTHSLTHSLIHGYYCICRRSRMFLKGAFWFGKYTDEKCTATGVQIWLEVWLRNYSEADLILANTLVIHPTT